MDEDGLCATCGGQPLLLAMVEGADPHVGEEAEGADREKIASIIAAGLSPREQEALARFLACPEPVAVPS